MKAKSQLKLEGPPSTVRRVFGTQLTNTIGDRRAQCASPPEQAALYRADILCYLLANEGQPCLNYLDFQPEIQENMRAILVDWLVDIHTKMRLQPETLFLSVSLIDRYLSIREVPKSRLQLVGATALLVASKFEETYRVPKLDDLVYICANTYTAQEIVATESMLLSALEFEIHRPSTFLFLNLLADKMQLDSKNFHLTWYILELCLLDYGLSSRRYCLLATAALYLVNKIRKRPQEHIRTLLRETCFSETEVRGVARMISGMLLGLESNRHADKVKEKFGRAEHEDVASIRIERVSK